VFNTKRRLESVILDLLTTRLSSSTGRDVFSNQGTPTFSSTIITSIKLNKTKYCTDGMLLIEKQYTNLMGPFVSLRVGRLRTTAPLI
jgi:hypothetical protein